MAALLVFGQLEQRALAGRRIERFDVRSLRRAVRSGRPLPRHFELVIEHDGLQREALVHLPEGFDRDADAPVIYNLHGHGGEGQRQNQLSGMAQRANRAGAIAVHPQGTADAWGRRSWNAKRCCGRAQREGIDDVGFLGALHETLVEELGADKKGRWTGLSNGGFMVYRLARELPPEQVAAIAPVAGLDVDLAPRPAHEVAVLHTHGMYDPLVTLLPSPIYALYGWTRTPLASARGWARHNGSKRARLRRTGDARPAQERIWRGDDGTETIFRLVLGGGHLWPGGHETTDRIVEWLLAQP